MILFTPSASIYKRVTRDQCSRCGCRAVRRSGCRKNFVVRAGPFLVCMRAILEIFLILNTHVKVRFYENMEEKICRV